MIAPESMKWEIAYFLSLFVFRYKKKRTSRNFACEVRFIQRVWLTNVVKLKFVSRIIEMGSYFATISVEKIVRKEDGWIGWPRSN